MSVTAPATARRRPPRPGCAAAGARHRPRGEPGRSTEVGTVETRDGGPCTVEAGAWRQRRRQARGGPRPSPEGQRHSHHHVQRPDEHVARPDVLVGARRRGPPANERGSEDRRGAAVSVGGRGPGMDAVYRVRSGRKFYTHGKTPYRPRTRSGRPPLSPRLRWALEMLNVNL